MDKDYLIIVGWKGYRAGTSIEVKSLGCLWTDLTIWGSQAEITGDFRIINTHLLAEFIKQVSPPGKVQAGHSLNLEWLFLAVHRQLNR